MLWLTRKPPAPDGQGAAGLFLPLLVVTVPAGLGEAAAVRTLANVLKRSHADCAAHAEVFLTHGHPRTRADRAYRKGMVDGLSDAQQFLREAIGDQFNIYDQLDARYPYPGDPDRKDSPPPRPRLPLSDTAHCIAEEVLEELYGQRDHLSGLSALFNSQAQGWKDEGADGVGDYHFYRGQSLAYAAAGDAVEQTIARLTGLTSDAYTAWAEEHGTCRGAFQ